MTWVAYLQGRIKQSLSTGLNEGLDPNKEYLLHIVYRLKEDMPWAKAGYIQAEEQLPVQVAAARPAIATAGKVNMSAVRTIR